MRDRLVPRAKRALLSIAARRYAPFSRDGRLAVAIETPPSFDQDAWRATLDAEFPGWQAAAQVRFVRNAAERARLAGQMAVYAGMDLSQDLIARAPALRWAHLLLAGVEFLDDLSLPAGLRITTAAGAAAPGVAEHVLGLMLMLARRLDLAVLQQQRWSWQQEPILGQMHTLAGRTVGIVGLGHNGRAVARLAAALGMRVIALDPIAAPTEGVARLYGPGELPELLADADFAVLCVPLTRETRGLIGAAELACLGPQSYLINVARGAVVDEAALAHALRWHMIAGAALDVLADEPPARHNPLRGCPNLIVTPHVAGNVHTFRDELRRGFARNLQAFVSGAAPEGLYKGV